MKFSKPKNSTVASLESTIRLSTEDAERFFDAIENASAPNDKLRAAVRDYMERLGKRQG
ncbi:MAG: DUF1778 domain-containing protein [Pedobacter sp.]